MFIPESAHENLPDYAKYFLYINIYIKHEQYWSVFYNGCAFKSLGRISPKWTPLKALLPFALDKFRVASSAALLSHRGP